MATSAEKAKTCRAEAPDMTNHVNRLCKQEAVRNICTVLALQEHKKATRHEPRHPCVGSYFNTPELGTATSQTKTLTDITSINLFQRIMYVFQLKSYDKRQTTMQAR
jgi:hypothetical protein